LVLNHLRNKRSEENRVSFYVTLLANSIENGSFNSIRFFIIAVYRFQQQRNSSRSDSHIASYWRTMARYSNSESMTMYDIYVYVFKIPSSDLFKVN